jgi:hypothetical protein
MNKLLLAIAMLFSVVVSATEDITGIWYDDTDTEQFYVVILNNEKVGYKFINFSFKRQETVNEVVLNTTETTINTSITSNEGDWNLTCEYSYIDEDTLQVVYEGDYNGTAYLKRKQIK